MKRSKQMKEGRGRGRESRRYKDDKRIERNQERTRRAAAEDMPITVVVSKDHILRGKRGIITQCPIALAIYDIFPAVNEVRVSTAGVRVSENSHWKLNNALMCDLCRFDATGEMVPMLLEVRLKGQAIYKRDNYAN